MYLIRNEYCYVLRRKIGKKDLLVKKSIFLKNHPDKRKFRQRYHGTKFKRFTNTTETYIDLLITFMLIPVLNIFVCPKSSRGNYQV